MLGWLRKRSWPILLLHSFAPISLIPKPMLFTYFGVSRKLIVGMPTRRNVLGIFFVVQPAIGHSHLDQPLSLEYLFYFPERWDE